MASLGSCAHSPSPPSAVPSASNLESIYVLDGSGSACAETAKSGRTESAIRFIFCLGCLRVSARDRIIRLLKRVLPRQLSRGSKQLYFEPVHTTATRSLVLEVGAEDLPGAYALDWQIFTSMPADRRFIPFSYFRICWKLTPTFSPRFADLCLTLGAWTGAALRFLGRSTACRWVASSVGMKTSR